MYFFFFKVIALWIGLKNKVTFSVAQKSHNISPYCHFLRQNLYHRSGFQIASNIFKFGVLLVQSFLRTMGKILAQSDRWFRSYCVFLKEVVIGIHMYADIVLLAYICFLLNVSL